MIVIEDTDGDGFDIRFEGDTKRTSNGTPENDLTAAEFWAKTLFEFCEDVLQEADIIRKNHNEKLRVLDS